MARYLSVGVTAPASGFRMAGDFYDDGSGRAGGLLDYRCTADGSLGTWEMIYGMTASRRTGWTRRPDGNALGLCDQHHDRGKCR